MKKAPILAFLVPLIVRSIPAILAWPHPIGFDTLIYTNVILKGTYLKMGVIGLLESPIFFYVIASLTSKAFGDVLLTVKALGPLLFGLLCYLFYSYSLKTLEWSPMKSLLVSLLASTYFISLRISLEMYRQILGLIFLMVGLTMLRLPNTKWRMMTVILSGFLAVWSHELAAVLFFVTMIAHFLVQRELRPRAVVALMAMPALILFMFQQCNPVIGGVQLPYESVVFASRIDSVGFVSGFLGYMFLPVLPLAVLGAVSFRRLDVWSWLTICLVFSYWPVLLPDYSVVLWFRWAILLVYPVVFLSVEGAERLWTSRRRFLWKFNVERVLVLSILLVNLAMSSYYLTSPPEHQIKYFGEWNYYTRFIQTSMLQNSVPLSDTPDVVDAMKWLNETVETNSVLLLHEAMDNWARILVRGVEIIRADEVKLSSQVRKNVATTLVQLAEEKAENGSEVYTVWWADGKGWYEMPELPYQFREVQCFGDIGVFQYQQEV